jgi:flagellar biosynthetic protein FlhB
VAEPDDKDSRTLPASPRRIQEFRKRGEIALSRDLVAAATLAGAIVGALTSLGSSGFTLRDFVRFSFEHLHDPTARMLIVHQALRCLLAVAGPIAGCAFVACFIAIGAQVGWPPALLGIKFDVTKPFSFGGLGNMLSPSAAVGRVLSALAKVGFVGGAAGSALSKSWVRLAHEPAPETAGLVLLLNDVALSMVKTAGGALILLAAVDYIRAKRSIGARMKMTPAEAKREYKENEGDPHVKGRRRRRMREMARRRLAAVVPKADVVLVNPTEYAVALRYDANEDRAPRVLAKGRGAAAERIREMARKAGVPIIPEPPLCRLIHKLVPEGKEIPSQLFSAVAEVLAYVYRLRGRTA